MNCHEPLNSGRNVSDRINPEREKKSDDVRSGILTEMCLEHIKTRSNPDAMDIGSLNGQNGVCRTCGQRGHWAAECPKHGKNGQGDKGQARKASQAKGKLMMAKEKAKVASGEHARHLNGIAITVGSGVTWKRIVSLWPKPRPRVVKAKSAGGLDESEANGPENISVGGFGLCSFGNECGDWKWNTCRKPMFTLDSGAAVSAAP